MDAFTDLPEDFDFVGGHGVAALHIVNATPELRFHIDAPHLSQVKTSIIVSKLHVIGCFNQKRALVVQEYVGADALQELDLMYVLTRLPEFARNLFRWVPAGVRLSAVHEGSQLLVQINPLFRQMFCRICCLHIPRKT